MTRYLLGLGSNMPDGKRRLQEAAEWLRANFSDADISDIYSSKALNGSAADYHNMVARVSSALSVSEITAAAKTYEAECGRSAAGKSAGRVEMDVDIVAADRTIIRPDEYTRPYFTHGLALLDNGGGNIAG